MLKLFFSVFVFVLLSAACWAQSSLNGNESYFENSFFEVEHMNDVDLLFPKGSDDMAFTSSFLLKGFINQKESRNRLLSFGIRSDLYTKRVWDNYYFDYTGRLHVSEYFTEISTAEVSMVKFFKRNFGLQLAGGVGLLNKKKAIPGLALWIQGGSDGAGGFHKILDNMGKQHGQINVGRDTLTAFVVFSPSVAYYLNVFTRQGRAPHTLVSEIGLNVCTKRNGNWAYFNNDLSLHMLRFQLLNRLFMMNLTGAGDFRLHRAGLKLDARIGTELSYGRVSFGYEITKQYGKENIDWVDYTDDENLYKLYLKVRLGKHRSAYFDPGKDKAM
ncbi:hypothetical protein [Maribellus sp. YY47]|uniref:hypothetical protein n=1 Tax=Maribellus sp. YY47 TaxID=2929486 RepID=UPI002001A240|nr:hypothetical protein [Maribellus sp. YY47]MCK3685223.1 hypothetical protein [Maribellus sp. YY47]